MLIPADVPKSAHAIFEKNYNDITKNKNRLMLFSADQKIEHLNDDFHGNFILPDVNNPRHLFNIASQGSIGAFATQPGLIARYASDYKNINYIAKLNSKTNLIATEQQDPISNLLWMIDDILELKKNGINIVGVGYTIYIGSQFEHIMLQEAAQVIYNAHKNGLIAILWVYPRGKSVKEKLDMDLIPGSTGLANALGADFVKIIPSQEDSITANDILKLASIAAGNTKVICSGGEAKQTEIFLKELYEQIHFGNSSGNATGRNIFQRSLKDAIAFTHAISAIVYDDKNIEEAIKIYQKLL